MKKIIIDMHERIRVRAYFLSLKYEAASALSCWLLAERTELQLAQRRTAAARKAAATRQANRLPGALIAAVATKRRPTTHRAVTH